MKDKLREIAQHISYLDECGAYSTARDRVITAICEWRSRRATLGQTLAADQLGGMVAEVTGANRSLCRLVARDEVLGCQIDVVLTELRECVNELDALKKQKLKGRR